MIDRRQFLRGASSLTALTSAGGFAWAASAKTEWLAFSRVFQKFGAERAADLLVEAGFTGVEWTIRPGGFVEPERVKEMLPKAVKAAERAGLSYDNIIVAFLNPYEGKNIDILKCAADCGIKAYRPGYFRYDYEESAAQSLERIRKGFDLHERAARETGLRMLYQNHSSYNRRVPLFGSLGWDLWEVIKERDAKYVGVQYDFMHARAECGPSWQRSLSLLGPWIGTLCLKDFRFAMDEKAPGDWKRELLPPGQGGVCDWGEFKSICRREGIVAPYTVHWDYDFPEDDYKAALKTAKRDLDEFKRIFSAG